jgi:hypothetical protein
MGCIALVVWRWRERPSVATGVLLGAVVLQVLDSGDFWERACLRGEPWPRLRASEWASVDPLYRHIVLFPPFIVGSEDPCVQGTFPEDVHARFGDLAYLKGITTNSGYAARLDTASVRAVCQSLRADVESGHLAEDTLYVVDAPERARFQRLSPGVACGTLDGFTVCVAAQEGQFREALMRAPPALVPQ